MARYAFLLLLAVVPALAEVSLEGLRREHPRLIALDSDIQRIRSLLKSDAGAQRLYSLLQQEAKKLETLPPVEYKLEGPRLLTQSRRCLERVYLLALLYRIQPAPHLLARALKELKAAAAFPNWNPSHFLDTAEMTHALAIGYDWLYPDLSGKDRELLRIAIVEKGLEPALAFYENRRGWTEATHNWNQVCNGGIGLGALAVAEDEPARAESILRYSVASLPLAMSSYAPDGGWNEGPGYWHYATRYAVYFLAGLNTALGTDFDLSKAPGFDKAGDFRIHFSSPTRRTFNYADAREGLEGAEEMFWLARQFNQPVYAGQQLDLLKSREKCHALDLVWYPVAASAPQTAGWRRDAWFRGVQTVFLRSSWDDPEAVWTAIKGGDNRANHSHLDLGTFVLDAGGQRWATDLGPDYYNLPQYFGTLRWSYYRLRTESHNTVLVDQENQALDAKAAITSFDSKLDHAQTTVDLTGAYPDKIKRHVRTLTLAERKRVVLRDQIDALLPVGLEWGMVTPAEARLDGKQAWLTQGGRVLQVTMVEGPPEARFEIVATQPPKPQNQNEGTRKLIVRLPGKVMAMDLSVAFDLQAAN